MSFPRRKKKKERERERANEHFAFFPLKLYRTKERFTKILWFNKYFYALPTMFIKPLYLCNRIRLALDLQGKSH